MKILGIQLNQLMSLTLFQMNMKIVFMMKKTRNICFINIGQR